MISEDSTRTDVRVWSEARLTELCKGGLRTAGELRPQLEALLRAAELAARVEVRGEVLVVSAILRRGGETALEKFELDPRSVGAGSPGEPSTARREIGARKAAEDTIITGLVDALELRHRLGQAREQVEGGLLYDLLSLGAQTLRELLHLNARANRSLLSALRTLSPAGAPGEAIVVTAEGRPGAVIRFHAASNWSGELMLENRRSGDLAVTLPREVSVCRDDGTGARTLRLRCTPDLVVLVRGERRRIEVCLVDTGPEDMVEWTSLGEMVLATEDGGLARVPVIVEVAR